MWPSHHTQGVVSDTLICLPSPFWPCRTCRPPTEPHFAILPVAPAASYRRRLGPTRSAVHRVGTRWPGSTAGPLPARPLLSRSRRGDPGRTPSLRVRHFQGLPIFGLLDSAGGLELGSDLSNSGHPCPDRLAGLLGPAWISWFYRGGQRSVGACSPQETRNLRIPRARWAVSTFTSPRYT